MTFACDYNFENFPFDEHDCDLEFGTPSGVINVTLTFAPVQVLDEGKPKQLVQDQNVDNKHLPFTFSIRSKSLYPIWSKEYQYPATGVTIHLKRTDLGSLMGRFYIPTTLFSILSLISFFINPDMVSEQLFY